MPSAAAVDFQVGVKFAERHVLVGARSYRLRAIGAAREAEEHFADAMAFAFAAGAAAVVEDGVAYQDAFEATQHHLDEGHLALGRIRAIVAEFERSRYLDPEPYGICTGPAEMEKGLQGPPRIGN